MLKIISLIQEKAKDLAGAIVQSEEFATMKKAGKEFSQSQEAQDLVKEYHQKQQTLQVAKLQGRPISEEEKGEMDTLLAQLQENRVLKSYMDAQNSFDLLMQKINQVISEEIQRAEETDIILP